MARVRAQGGDLMWRKRRPEVELHFHVAPEAPAPGILHWLETHPYDLAALGSHGRRGLRRALMGSVAEVLDAGGIAGAGQLLRRSAHDAVAR